MSYKNYTYNIRIERSFECVLLKNYLSNAIFGRFSIRGFGENINSRISDNFNFSRIVRPRLNKGNCCQIFPSFSTMRPSSQKLYSQHVETDTIKNDLCPDTLSNEKWPVLQKLLPKLFLIRKSFLTVAVQSLFCQSIIIVIFLDNLDSKKISDSNRTKILVYL